MEKNIKKNLKELKQLYENGYLFFKFVSQPIGMCVQVNDAKTNELLYMCHVLYEDAQEIIKQNPQEGRGIMVVQPKSNIYRLFLERLNECN